MARGSNPGGGEILPTVQTGPGAHPASYTMGTGSFPGVKRPGYDDHLPSSRAEVVERVELYIYSLSRPSWFVLGRPLPYPQTLQTGCRLQPVSYSMNALSVFLGDKPAEA